MDNSDFVTKFYSLEGDLISERKKNFFRLLNSHPIPLNENELNNLIPRTYLERLFQIDIFIYYKLYSKLLDVIKEGNEAFISKILKHPLILKEVIGNITAESFVNDFLPFTSYTIRMKILKKISFFLGEPQMDEIIFWVQKRYGLYIAVKILHTCSSKKIEEFLSSHEIILKPRQVKYIFDKDPDLLLMYFNHYQDLTKKPYYHKHLCRYIALKNPELWFKLKEKRAIYILRLGRKASKNIICYNYSAFLKNVELYSGFLRLDVIVRKLHGKFTDIYFELFPRNMSDLCMGNFCQTLLNKYPKNKQWDLFAQTFLNVFGSTVIDKLLHLDHSFLKLLPNKSLKNKWAEVHYNDDKSKFHLLQNCDPNIAIPLIKEKINVTSDILERTKLVNLLILNCASNEDMLALEAILKYICIRHRNEDTLYRILQGIKNMIKLDDLNESHWNYVNEIMQFLRLRKLLSFYVSNEFTLKHIEYLVLHGKPIKEELTIYIKDIDMNKSWLHMNVKDPAIEKQILTEIINTSPSVIELYETQKENFISDIINFNEKNPEHKLDISNFPYLFTYIDFIIKKDWELESNEKKILEKVLNYNLKFPEKPIIIIEEQQILKIFRNNIKDFCFTDAVGMIVAKLNRSQFENDVLHLFWEHLLTFSSLRKKIVCWLFDNEPKTLIPYFDRVIAIDKKCISYSKIKLMSHLHFDKMIISFCTGKLELIDDFIKDIREKYAAGGDCDAELTKEIKEKIESNIDSDIIEVLSLLLSTREYIESVAQRFLPVKERLNIKDEALNEIYFLQCLVAKYFKKMQEPAVALPTLMKFCLGDYLKSALPALYSICYRAPENIVYSYVVVLSKRAVSVKKHALFLSCQLLNYNYVLNKIQEANTSNVKSQKHVFSSTLKYFCKNPCDELLNLVIVSLNTIDKNDEETLKRLTKVHVPKKYKRLYIEKCWYFYESLREKEVSVIYYLELFLNDIVMSETIFASLSANLYRHIMSQFKDDPERDCLLRYINQFVCMILQQKTSEQIENFEFVFNIIFNFKHNKKIDGIKSFFDVFYSFALKDIKSNSKIDLNNNYYIELFKKNWNKLFTPTEMFDEHVLLDLLYLKSKSSCDLKIYTQEIVRYLEELVVEYGPYIYYKFKNILLSKEKYTEMEKYTFFYNILEFKNSTVNCILILDLMESKCHNDEIKELYNKVKQMLNSSTDPVVSVYYNSCLG